jgi:transcription antitermination protein NusB
MGARGTGRESALQMLFALEAGSLGVEQVISAYWRHADPDMWGGGAPDAESRGYADSIVRGVAETQDACDEAIRRASTNWRLERMARVDRNVLRLGTWELMQKGAVPRAVILDEAVELAKRFGTEDSGAFVNGVLDRIADDLGVV